MNRPLELELKTLYGNMPEDQRYVDDIYDSLEKARSEHMYDLIVVGYCIVDTKTKEIYPDTADWYETFHEAEDTRVNILKSTNPPPELHAMIRTIENGNQVVDTRHVTFRSTNPDVYTEDQLKEHIMTAMHKCMTNEKLQAPLNWDETVKLLIKYPHTCESHGFECIVSGSSSLYQVSSTDTCKLS